MDFKFLSHRIRNIILNPVKAWEAICSENRPIRDVRDSFFFPLVTLVAVSAFLGSLLFTNTELSWVDIHPRPATDNREDTPLPQVIV